jgi:hypothetical protein
MSSAYDAPGPSPIPSSPPPRSRSGSRPRRGRDHAASNSKAKLALILGGAGLVLVATLVIVLVAVNSGGSSAAKKDTAGLKTDGVPPVDPGKDLPAGDKGPGPDGPKDKLDKEALLALQIQQQLNKAGAQGGEVQVSLFWTSKNDLDLYVVTPRKERIFYAYRNSTCGGTLDVDQNVEYPTATTSAVENVFWPEGKAQKGQYQVLVDFYSDHGGLPECPDPAPFTVRLVIQGKTEIRHGTVSRRGGKKTVLVETFEVR